MEAKAQKTQTSKAGQSFALSTLISLLFPATAG